MKIQQIKERLTSFDDVDFAGAQSPEKIDAAEQLLGVQFPPDYRRFLLEFGCGGVDSEEFIGLGGDDHLSVVKLTKRLRDRSNRPPDNLLPVRADGFGNYDCIDFNRPAPNGEYCVVQWSHEGGIEQHHELLATSYGEWFESILQLIEEDR